MSPFIRWFNQISLDHVALVGGKNASLGELWRELIPLGIKVPAGFAVTAECYWRALDQGGIKSELFGLLSGLDTGDTAVLEQRAEQARTLIRRAGLPDDVWAEVAAAYDQLGKGRPGGASVAVRSSATAEDLPNASFAGQQESFLNVRGHEQLRVAVVECMASLFTARAVSYRIDQGFSHDEVALSVGVQLMVRSDLASSGVIFTLDTESGFADVVIVTAGYGLGENIVKGTITPDEHCVFKPTLAAGKQAIVRRRLGDKQLRMVLAEEGSGMATRNEPVPGGARRRFALSDGEVLALARQAVAIERHYSRSAGAPVPMDIEWAKDGETGELFIVQARPETVQARKSRDVLETYKLERRGEVVLRGQAVGQRIGAGPARVVSAGHLSDFRPGDVLVATITTPDWEPIMKRAAAIVTDRGGRTCHAAIVARELGIPAIVGAEGATSKLRTGAPVTVSCAEGDTGVVYRGALPFHVETTEIAHLARPRTKMLMNVGDPSTAFALASTPCDGVGLARLEFIISGAIGVHPMALLHPEGVMTPEAQSAIAELTAGYADKAEYFVDRLAQGVATIAAAFYPKPVIVRFSDFKSSEYAGLVGGEAFEPKEENPMLGLRGASRYTHPSYREAFALECRALRRVREDMGLSNVRLLIPFCRTVSEAERVLAALRMHGLERGRQGLEVLVMCEIPNNVLQIDAFCALFDGISIGSNDLAQLTLGVDRDSALVAFEFDELDPGVLKMLEMAVTGARRAGRSSGICGQAPSDFPPMAEFLVRLGIDSISLDPDSVLPTTLRVLDIERSLEPPPTSTGARSGAASRPSAALSARHPALFGRRDGQRIDAVVDVLFLFFDEEKLALFGLHVVARVAVGSGQGLDGALGVVGALVDPLGVDDFVRSHGQDPLRACARLPS